MARIHPAVSGPGLQEAIEVIFSSRPAYGISADDIARGDVFVAARPAKGSLPDRANSIFVTEDTAFDLTGKCILLDVKRECCL